MAGITVIQAQTVLDALIAAAEGFTGKAKVSIQTAGGGHREVQYTSMDELSKAINFWSRALAGAQRQAAGSSRHGVSLANIIGSS